MSKAVKLIGKTEIVTQRGDGKSGMSIWTRVRKNVGVRLDSWLNLLTGIGVPGLDPGTATDFSRSPRLADSFLENLYNGDDVAARIVDAIPEEAFSEGYEVAIEADERGEAQTDQVTVDESKRMGSDIVQHLENDLGATEKLIEGWSWGRLYGSGAIFMIVDDGPDADLAEELDLERVRKIDSLMVLDKVDMDPATSYDDPSHPKFGETETYFVNTMGPSGTFSGQAVNVRIHESRLIMFEGARTTRRERQTGNGFSLSVLQRVFDVLKQFNISWSALANMLQSASLGVFSVDGLLEMIAGGESDTMQRRMQLVDLQKSVARSVMVDAEREKYEQLASNLTGVPDSLRVFMLRIASAAKMPLTKLMGMSPAGMNATGESDRLIWAKDVTMEQNRVLRPRLARLVLVAMSASEGPTKGKVPERWSVVFPPLVQMTEKEEAEIRKLTADADAVYITAQVLLPEEVAISRFPATGFSTQTIIDVTDRAELLKDPGGPEPEPVPDPDPKVVPEPDKEPAADPDAVDPTAAFNGGQVQSLMAIVDKVISGAYSKDTAAKIIEASFPLSLEDAQRILEDVEVPEDDDSGGDPPPPPPGGNPPPVPPPTGTEPPPGPADPPGPPVPPEPPEPPPEDEG